MKVLVVRLSAFGDIIHCLPALDDLLINPDVSEVHWLVDERYAFVSEIFPARVQIHRVALKGRNPLQSAWQVIRRLRAIRFDAVIDLQGLIKSSMLARACGSPVYGIDKRELREKISALLTTPVPFHAEERHVVQQYRHVVAEACHQDASLPIPYKPPHIDLQQTHCSANADLLAELGLSQRGYVILHTAGGWATKQLPTATWLNIARSLPEVAATAVFSWGNDAERMQAQSLAAACGGFALPERLSMSSLCALLTGARAVVGADTGLLHLAAALDTPTVTFWGPSASWRSAPIGDKHWHVESNPDCGPCFKRTCDQFICMDRIRPDAIVKVLHEL
ncbi:MAG: lipopolysaccharide heptosyltransferase I [Zetaproteobacteria bacterium CG12_big_fil_rev_8_21_14_0_65_54_13]|nr:MAG: lipopolysaccharide heptosyltransferase I [Zetaproteobacteria bacterium CG23_combo_of_CG06-09_8_20_14_all_54_7]PIW44877.1 MAG: lipopolysaccharide heptosyltransferase I [Zetaproteobacteria bacterium CG12_big_fil_rev_8_21_14_0_65_54_13]PJA28224.1 MAG: lipopolysaccharide heptosyltransferase I [Zetaproteobacteria bacterium CG_4_9_14_3_um_filter_54_145]